MGWDSSRPVPWARLVREWVLYAVLMTAVFALFFRDRGAVGAIGGLLASGPLYLLLGAAMAKLGVQRRTIRETRAAAREARAAREAQAPTRPRPRPAPTRRTGGGARPTGRTRR